ALETRRTRISPFQEHILSEMARITHEGMTYVIKEPIVAIATYQMWKPTSRMTTWRVFFLAETSLQHMLLPLPP
ncbi:unnamed protein product, partial [Urochloa humidicola]